MATTKTKSDALGFYHTGADFDGGPQSDPDASLGGFRAHHEVRNLTALMSTPIGALRVDVIGGANGVGDGVLTGQDISSAAEIEGAIDMSEEDKQTMFGIDTITWTAPNGSAGTAVVIGDGDELLIEDVDTQKAIRIKRDSFLAIGGSMGLSIRKTIGNVLGFRDVTDAERTAGEDYYHAIMLDAHGGAALTNVELWINPLSYAVTSGAGQLGASGAGTLSTAGTFGPVPPRPQDWSTEGWCRIIKADTTTRETVYYESRTETALTVRAGDRGLLGTSAEAGASNDTLYAVGNVRIAAETVSGGGSIQTIATELTAPTGRTWQDGVVKGDGITVGSMGASGKQGIWIHREIPAALGDLVVASPGVENAIGVSFDVGGTTYETTLAGLHRIARAALARFELFVGEDADPDITGTPDATSTSLPFSFSVTPPGGGTKELRFLILKRNAYNVASLNQYLRTLVIDSGGDEVEADLADPVNVELVNVAGGETDVVASYFPANDVTPADEFAIYQRGNGTDPNTSTDTPIIVTMVAPTHGLRSSIFSMRHALGPNGNGTDLRVIVRARRNSDSKESPNTTVLTTTVDTTVPDVPTKRRLTFGSAFHDQLAPPVIIRTVYIDQPNNVRWVLSAGKTELWGDGVLVWRIIYDSVGQTDNGIWTTFGIRIGAQISGVPSTTPAEVESWNGSKIINLSVNDGFGTYARRMRIDVTNSLIHFSAFAAESEAVTTGDPAPIVAFPWHTTLQVFDVSSGNYDTAASLDPDGRFALRVGWRQRQTTGEFPDP